MAKLNVGFIGCGGIAQRHMEAIAKISNARMVGFCDIDLEKAQAAADHYGGKAFQVPADMLDSLTLDAVWICLPPFAHGEAERACIAAGVPFMVEKPINRSAQQARRIADAVAQKGLLTAVAYLNRYRKGVRKAREIFQEDAPVLAMGGWISGTPNPDPARPISVWWVQKEKSGGQFVEQVTHTADLLRFIAGEAMQVSAFAATGFNANIPGYNIEDAIGVSVKLARGGVALLYSCCASNAKGGIMLNIHGLEHTAEFSGWNHDAVIYTAGRKKPQQIPGEPNPFELEDRAFLRAVAKEDPSYILCDYADGLKTLELTLAVDRALSTARIVKLGM
ncbi:MAG: Gfo/Idh/MocA family oxidoreductase [Armatimonadetes bacterium]|nr:Gfo/Idh/MocA family oxidoreductase [Armatimonadota bacterium]